LRRGDTPFEVGKGRPHFCIGRVGHAPAVVLDDTQACISRIQQRIALRLELGDELKVRDRATRNVANWFGRHAHQNFS
jgi:hypothetical protein